MRNRILLAVLVSLCVGSIQKINADEPLKANDYSWTDNIRTEHPRMFITSDDIPYIKKAALSFEHDTYIRMKNRADLLLGKEIIFDDPLTATGEGKQNRLYGYYAADAALMWLITDDKAYLDLTKDILSELTSYYRLRVSHNLNIEWYALTQICALCAYDWIYNDLSDEEKISLGRPLFDVMCEIAWHGPGIRKPRFRENTSGYKSGFYGVSVLPWFIGLTFWKEGFDDKFCNEMVCNGYDQHQKMTAYRSKMLGTKGGGASGVPWYCMYYYPYAEYDFIYTFRSAVGIDIRDNLKYMKGYLNYMDWIRLPGNREYGFGDSQHYECLLPHQYMNGHVYEIANLFGDGNPEILTTASRLLENFTAKSEIDPIPFMRLLHRIDISEIKKDPKASQSKSPKSMYFDTMGQLYMRSGIGDDDTYALFVTGGLAAQHKHFDNNNFIIYKHGFRALDSGARPEPGWHLPYYYCRTVAHNCITIHMEGEELPRYWGGPSAIEEKNLAKPNDGGQNKILGAEVIALEETEDYVYVASDATECYNKDKADLVVREFIWCVPDIFVIMDRVVSDKAEYTKRWLYHTATEPDLRGKMEFSETSQGGKSICRTLLPEKVRIEKVGGPGKQFWSDGRNWPIPDMTPEDYGYANRHQVPGNEHPMVGQWRIEVYPEKQTEKDIFLHIIKVGDETLRTLPKTKTIRNGKNIELEFRYDKKIYQLIFDMDAKSGCTINVM